MSEQSRPQLDPITNRLICEACWNQKCKFCHADHDGKDKSRKIGLCNCMHHDVVQHKQAAEEAVESMDIQTVYGSIDIK